MTEPAPIDLPLPQAGDSPPSWLARRLPLGVTTATALLALIAILAAFLRFFNLGAIGDGNPYYTAAVKSMLLSWKNFFFGAAEPGGSVSIDKPPLGFWFQALSARLFGLNGFAVALPQILAGILSVILLYFLVKRYFGPGAGLLAAFVLAVTPILIAVSRSNEIDGTLVLALLLAAWAFLRAADRSSLGYLLLGAVFIGLGFNIKMLEAFLPLPALYALYLLGAQRSWGTKLLHLVAASAVLLAVSFSWAVIVDRTPASQRPYVGSSQNNSVVELALGYNGLARLIGIPFFAMGHGVMGRPPVAPEGPAGAAMTAEMEQFAARFAYFDAGRPGPLRLFLPPLATQASWLLPFALFSIVLAAAREPLRLPLSPLQRSLVLWGGWLLTGVVFFSIASFIHTYYLATLAPSLAAMTALGAYCLWRLYGEKPRLAALLLFLFGSLTLAFQAFQARILTADTPWLIPAAVCLLAGIILGILALRPWAAAGRARFQGLALAAVLIALLVTPTAWGVLTTLDPTPNTVLPSAYTGRLEGFSNLIQAFVQLAGPNPQVASYLEAHTQGEEYLMAVPSAMMGGSEYVLLTGRPVLFMGGFIGTDPVVTPQELSTLASQHRLSYVWDSFGVLRLLKPEIYRWVQSSCKPVEQVPLPELSSGTLAILGRVAEEMRPGGIPATGSSVPRPALPQSVLYRCGS